MKRGKRRFFAPAASTVKAERSAHEHVVEQYGDTAPREGPLRVDVEFRFALPKKANGCAPGDPCLSRVDRGNLLKLIEDAMTGVVYVDDSQIVSGDVRKVWHRVDETIVWVSKA
jgi:Holliday junction resolvase RusA-like endonuclease